MLRSARILFIVNPAAGGRRSLASWEKLQRQLNQSGVKGNQVITTEPGDARRLAQQSAGQYEILVAVGGDGTACEVAGGILASGHSRTVLGFMPCGTGNDSAHALGIHSQTDTLWALTGGRTRWIDVIEVHCMVNGTVVVRHALLFAAVGITGDLLARTTSTMKRFFGERLAYRLGLMRSLLSYRARPVRVTCNAQVREQPFLLACASNSERAGGGIPLAPGAQLDDGRLNINLIEALGRWEALLQFSRVCRGRHTTHPKVRYFTGVSLAVDGEPPFEVAADGELLGHTPARFVVKPQALQVAVIGDR